jgi:predicted MFS family arabinose efflux permease
MGGNSRSWSDPLVISLLVISVVLGILFCIIEAKIAVNPLMPYHIISSRTPLACAFVNFFSVMVSFSQTYTTPLFFQGVLGYSSSQAGLFYLPKIIAMSCGSVSSGYWMSRTGEYKKFITFSTLIAFCSMVGISTWSDKSSFAFIIFCLILDGFASGANLTSSLVAMLSSVGTAGKKLV